MTAAKQPFADLAKTIRTLEIGTGLKWTACPKSRTICAVSEFKSRTYAIERFPVGRFCVQRELHPLARGTLHDCIQAVVESEIALERDEREA